MQKISTLLLTFLILFTFTNCGSTSSTSSQDAPTIIETTTTSALAKSLESGDVNGTTEIELLAQTRKEIARLKAGNTLLKELYKNEAITYNPGNRSQLININGDSHKIFSIIQGSKSKTLAVAGIKNKSRFSAFGAAPMEHFEDNSNLTYQKQFKRLLAWLIVNNTEANLDVNKTIALSFAKSDTTDITNWITKNYPKWTINYCQDDTSDLKTCYKDVDLIITGWQTDTIHKKIIRDTLESQTKLGTPVMYLHTWYEAYNDVAHSIANLFHFELPYGGNYWAKDSASWASVERMQAAVYNDYGYAKIDKILEHFELNDYAIDWSKCDDKGQGDNCTYTSDFGEGITKLREIITTLDKNKTPIFKNSDYRLQKLFILLGDRMRRDVSFPMDKNTTNDTEFFKSLYADYSVYNYRKINHTQKDMGNFSRSNFSHITPTTKTITLRSKKNFRSAGVYALPGQTLQVTRNDNTNVVTKIFINSLRSGSTHEFQKDAYTRPKFLKTQSYLIENNETIQITSPYGGPVHISFDTNDLNTSFTFENIGEHAYWASSSDDTSFTSKLNADEYDWAEIVTTGFEVHSTLEKMKKSVSDSKWGSADVLASATKRYMSNFPHVLAGFQGPGIDVVDEIHDFAKDKNISIANLDLVKHMNADQATCGYGCSGNPYDAYWAFSPIGHGDVHELGHGLEKSKFRFEGWEGHSTTNPYSYYTKSKYNETTGDDPACQNLPFQEVFEKLQRSVKEVNATEYLKTNLWANSSWSQQFMVTLQAMMHAQKLSKLENGWHLLARLHILERNIKTAKTDWDTLKSSIGFSDYTLEEFNAISANDWLLISLSFAVEIDFRDYLTMMGIEYSQKASTTVSSFNYVRTSKEFFVSTPNGYCKTDSYGAFLNKTTLNVDGTSVWPE